MNRSQRIQSTLTKLLSPTHIEVIDDSRLHSRGRESHFRLLIVSTCFEALSPLQRQQRVLKALKSEFQQGLHSISQKVLTPAEWQAQKSHPPQASKCFHAPR